MATIGVVVPAFALREVEPNPCNVRLAEETVRIVDELKKQGHDIVLVVQWEVDKALVQSGAFRFLGDGDETLLDYAHQPDELRKKLRLVQSQGFGAYGVVGPRDDGVYLDTKFVVSSAEFLFREAGVERVVVVANPFVHRAYTYRLFKQRGWELLHPVPKVGWVGFDPESTQWWCRSWWQFSLQAVHLAFGGKSGHNGRQEPNKS